jgi:hypothetical protein
MTVKKEVVALQMQGNYCCHCRMMPQPTGDGKLTHSGTPGKTVAVFTSDRFGAGRGYASMIVGVYTVAGFGDVVKLVLLVLAGRPGSGP